MEIVEYTGRWNQKVLRFTDTCFHELGKVFEPYGRHSYYTTIPQSFKRFWCLISDETVIGSAAVAELDGETAELKAMYLDSRYRGQGLGYQLLTVALNYAREAGYKRIMLDSMQKYRDALRLYERAGFTRTQRYNENMVADVFMEKQL